MRASPSGWLALLDAHDQILRGPGTLSIGERELIAAYVSALNECAFCRAAHTVYAERYGMSEVVLLAALEDPAAAPIPRLLQPVLAYARCLALTPSAVAPHHIAAIASVDHPPSVVHEVAKVVALFSLMNRIILGLGVASHAARYARRLAAVRRLPLHERLADNARHVGTAPYRAYGESIGLHAR